jgi:hypothetical protein
MDPIIEILAKNIILDKRISKDVKEQFILIMNRISSFKTIAQQLYRQNSFHTLYNLFHEEIQFLIEQKKGFKDKLKGNTLIIFNEYLDLQINLYNKHILNYL